MITLNKFENDILNLIADECGLSIVPHNADQTTFEIEFFAKQIIRECISVVDEESQNSIKKYFGIKEHQDEKQLNLF